MPDVVVTGGAGFIGAWTVEALLACGYRVTVVDDLSTGHAGDLPGGVEVVEASVLDAGRLARVVQGADAVVHLAALRAVPRSVRDPLATDLVNTHGTLTVLDVSARAGVERVVLASSSSVYGAAAALPTPESEVLSPLSPYAASKVAGEHYARIYHQLHDLPTTSLRLFNAYGPRQRPDHDWAPVLPRLTDSLLRGERPVIHGDGRQRRDFTHVTDIARAVVLTLDAPVATVAGRAYNIGGGRPASVLELLELVASHLGAEADPVFGRSRPGDVPATHADASAAAADLGWRARTSLEAGVAGTVEWLTSALVPV